MSNHGMNCRHPADNDESCTCAATERTMHEAWRKRAEEAESRLAALESKLSAMTRDRDERANDAALLRISINALGQDLQEMTRERDSQAEAVRVLARRVHSCEHMLACYRIGRRPSEVALDTARSTAEALSDNFIAAVAVRGAS